MRRKAHAGLIALAATLLAAACASVDSEPPEAAPKASRQAAAPAPSAAASESADRGTESTAAEVAGAIEKALAEGWRELHLLDECIVDDEFQSVEIFGSGVAIWGNKKQFTLTYDQVRQQLEALRESGFADFAPRYGGRTGGDSEAEDARRGSSSHATRVICRIELEIDGVSKQVIQLHRGEQSAELLELAKRILEGCRESARSGTTAASLDDGLRKAAAGELAAETVRILFHRKPEPGEDAEGWLLRLEGLAASTRTFRPGEGYGEVHELEIDPDGLAELLELLASQAPEELPVNLYAERYTDVTISVLDQRTSLQARQFADLTPTGLGERQERFDRISAALEALHRRVVAGGRLEPLD